jgi:hypothetical protein
MKLTITLQKVVITTVISALFSSSFCFATETLSNSLQVEFKQYSEQDEDETNILSLDSVYQIPVKTYDYFDEVLTSFYNNITFNTAVTKSTFKNSSHYELIAIPLISENNQGVQIELFGNFSNPTSNRLSNCSEDQALSNYYSNTEQFDIKQSDLSVGAGISFNTSKDIKIKVIISNNDMPGYGNSNALFGFETSF